MEEKKGLEELTLAELFERILDPTISSKVWSQLVVERQRVEGVRGWGFTISEGGEADLELWKEEEGV